MTISSSFCDKKVFAKVTQGWVTISIETDSLVKFWQHRAFLDISSILLSEVEFHQLGTFCRLNLRYKIFTAGFFFDYNR